MRILSFFTNNGTPQTGLSPTIDIWEPDGTQVVNAQSMTEIDGGFYYYEFSSYDGSKDYSIRAYGGASLPTSEQYVFGSNEMANVLDEQLSHHTVSNSFGEAIGSILDDTDILRDVHQGDWKIVSNQMIFYDRSGSELMRFNLYDSSGNPSSDEVFEREKV